MTDKIEQEKKEKRYQELSRPYRILLWLRWMPLGYIKGLGWYFIKMLRWEHVCDDESGRVSLGTCIGICVGTVQGNMKWYYTSDEVFGEDGYVKEKLAEDGLLEKIGNFIEDKIVEIVDGKMIYD
jgi:hypothetical protein